MADPIDPGAIPTATITLTGAQSLKLAEIAMEHQGPVRLESLTDAYVRAVLIGPDGDPVTEQLLFPR